MKSDNSFAVAIFGIPDFERELVRRIFSLSESRDHVYRIVDGSQSHAADIALVDRSDGSDAGEFAQFHSERQDLPMVIIPNGKDPESDFWVKRPFTAMRMLGALDKLVEDRLSGANRPPPKSPAPAQGQAPTAPETTAAKTDDTASTPAIEAGIYKALVVDDSLAVRKQVSVALRRAGITAEFAENAESALKLIESRRYDILFLDVVLPGKDGYEICKAVKRDKDKKHIPVVMLTGKSSPFDKVKGKLSGCDAYLTKPVSLKEFNKTLSKWLNPPLSYESMADAT
jgi:twitching motility two-component system response regulator PilG